MKHIMLDLETLDTTSSAVVISIGAVAFDPETSGLGDKFYVETTEDTAAQQARGRTISGDTVRWWMQQDVLAKRVFSVPPPDGVERVNTFEALSRFGLFVAANGDLDVELWGNGADFDNVIIGSLFDTFGLVKPWSYGKNRCYRTMKRVFGENVPLVRQGVHHNGLDDAITQAVHLQEIFACVTRR